MKLTRIPGHEPTLKQSWALKTSTVTLLQQYHDMYVAATGAEVSLKDVVEQMLLDFMAEDKEFQKALRQKRDGAPAAPAVQAHPRVGHDRVDDDSSGGNDAN